MILFAFLTYSHPVLSKTFSCGVTYEDPAGKPHSSLHVEQDYSSVDDGRFIEISREDSRFVLKGYLKLNNNQEFLNIEITSKDTGFNVFNNNSQIGQPAASGFNFVFVGMKNIGVVTTSKGIFLEALKGSFQCQTY